MQIREIKIDPTLLSILLATTLSGIISISAAAALSFALLSKMVERMVSLSVGILLSTSLLHALPEAFESQADAHALFATLLGGLLSACVLIALNAAVAVATSHSARLQTLMEGEPVLIGKDGRLFDRVLKQQHVPPSDVRQALREVDCELGDMQCAFLEADGQISILKKKQSGSQGGGEE